MSGIMYLENAFTNNYILQFYVTVDWPAMIRASDVIEYYLTSY